MRINCQGFTIEFAFSFVAHSKQKLYPPCSCLSSFCSELTTSSSMKQASVLPVQHAKQLVWEKSNSACFRERRSVCLEEFQDRIMEVAARSSDPDQNRVGTIVRRLKREWRGRMEGGEHGPLFKKICSAFENSRSPPQWVVLSPGRGMCAHGVRCAACSRARNHYFLALVIPVCCCSVRPYVCGFLFPGYSGSAVLCLSSGCFGDLSTDTKKCCAVVWEVEATALTFFHTAALIFSDRTGVILTFKCHCQQYWQEQQLLTHLFLQLVSALLHASSSSPSLWRA